MRISDWSSDVCSSDLIVGDRRSVLEAVLVSRFQRNALAIAADSSSELVGVDCLAKQVGRVEVLAHIGRDNGLAGVVDDSFLHDGAGKLRASDLRRLELCLAELESAAWRDRVCRAV